MLTERQDNYVEVSSIMSHIDEHDEQRDKAPIQHALFTILGLICLLPSH